MWKMLISIAVCLSVFSPAVMGEDGQSTINKKSKMTFEVKTDWLTGIEYLDITLKMSVDEHGNYMGFWAPVPKHIFRENYHWSALYRGKGRAIALAPNEGSLVKFDHTAGNICVFLDTWQDRYDGTRMQDYTCAQLNEWIVEGGVVTENGNILDYGGGFQRAFVSDEIVEVPDAENILTYNIKVVGQR